MAYLAIGSRILCLTSRYLVIKKLISMAILIAQRVKRNAVMALSQMRSDPMRLKLMNPPLTSVSGGFTLFVKVMGERGVHIASILTAIATTLGVESCLGI